MSYAVALYLDPQVAKPLISITTSLAEKGIAEYIREYGVPLHITVAIYEELKCQPCQKKIEELSKKLKGMSITLSHLGIFQNSDPVVFAAPTVTEELTAFHRTMHETLDTYAVGSWDMYKPNNWVPHCTLADQFPKENLNAIINECSDLEFPMVVPITSIGVVEFEPIKHLYEYPVNGK